MYWSDKLSARAAVPPYGFEFSRNTAGKLVIRKTARSRFNSDEAAFEDVIKQSRLGDPVCQRAIETLTRMMLWETLSEKEVGALYLMHSQTDPLPNPEEKGLPTTWEETGILQKTLSEQGVEVFHQVYDLLERSCVKQAGSGFHFGVETMLRSLSTRLSDIDMARRFPEFDRMMDTAELKAARALWRLMKSENAVDRIDDSDEYARSFVVEICGMPLGHDSRNARAKKLFQMSAYAFEKGVGQKAIGEILKRYDDDAEKLAAEYPDLKQRTGKEEVLDTAPEEASNNARGWRP